MGMDSKKLAARQKQPGHDRTFEHSESEFAGHLREILDAKNYSVSEKPRDLGGLFIREGGKFYGVIPEVSVEHLVTHRKAFFEVKKQGLAGNADERACKHHTVQFYKTLRDHFGYDYHPFFTIFCEHLATHERYTVKHKYFFETSQYFCWIDYDRTSLDTWIRALCKSHLDP